MDSEPNLKADGVILRNLKGAMYKMGVHPITARVTSLVSSDDIVVVGTIGYGCQLFRLGESQFEPIVSVGGKGSKKKDGSSFYDLTISSKIMAYVKEEAGVTSVCVHQMKKLLDGDITPSSSLYIKRRSSMVCEPDLQLLVLGGAAWSSSWTGGGDTKSDVTMPDCEETHLRVIHCASMDIQTEWKAVDNAVAYLRQHRNSEHSLLGVADSRAGLKVYDLRQSQGGSYHCLYQVPVDEVRNFQLVGDFVAVFHKFEPNVSFWNMKEQKTILCINIQDQMKELAEEFMDEDEEDCGLFGDDDDHVTAVTSVRSDDDHILMYGTKSGCIFGMSVNRRSKLFNIPCPVEVETGTSAPRSITGLAFVPEGKVVATYDKEGLTMLDFSPVNPPDRPPTRCQKRPT